jgi:hypothetical protein
MELFLYKRLPSITVANWELSFYEEKKQHPVIKENRHMICEPIHLKKRGH